MGLSWWRCSYEIEHQRRLQESFDRVAEQYAGVLRWLDGNHHDDNPHCRCWECDPGTNGLENN